MKSILTILTFQILLSTATFAFGNQNYTRAVKLSLLFFEAQRSGHLPSNNRIPWRGDSALDDKGENGEDLSGGYYDTSDYVKFGFTMAFTTTILSWGVISYEDSYREIGEYENVLDAIKWTTDYFIKCHTKENEFYGQIGNFAVDHKFWGRPEELNMTRPAYKINIDHPGTDLAAEASATFSSASIVFYNINSTYADQLLLHSKQLYAFAKNYKGFFQDVLPGSKEFYESKSFYDELTWAALWLYKATNQSKYLDEAQYFYSKFEYNVIPQTFFYNEKWAGIQILFSSLIPGDVVFSKGIQKFCNFAVDEQLRTKKGLIFVDKYGTLSHVANIAFICLEASNFNISSEKYQLFAKQQIDYILGSTGRSYVVGFGSNYPKRPFHAASSCPNLPESCNWSHYNSTESNPQILYGALVSGPDLNDNFIDVREEFLYTEVSLDYNAGFQGALVGLLNLSEL